MKKNIAIAVLILLCGVFLIFSWIKAEEAEKNFILAERERQFANENAAMAKYQEENAIMAAAEAARQAHRANVAEKELAQCRSN